MASKWAAATTLGGLATLQAPTSFKWVLPNKRRTISGIEVDVGKPSIELTYSALRAQQYWALANMFGASGQTLYVTLPIEHNLLTTGSNLTNDISWATFVGKLSRPLADKLHTTSGVSGWRETVTIKVSQLVYVQAA